MSALPPEVRAGTYAYAEIAVEGEGIGVIWGVAVVTSDAEDPGVGGIITLYDPNNSVLADNQDYNGSGWDVVVFGTPVGISGSSQPGTYNAKAIGYGQGGWYGCSPFVPLVGSTLNHHYNHSGIQGGKSLYTLNPDSNGRMCSRQGLLFTPTHLSGISDSGLAFHWGPIVGACFQYCSAGQNGPVSGPAGPTRPITSHCD